MCVSFRIDLIEKEENVNMFMLFKFFIAPTVTLTREHSSRPLW